MRRRENRRGEETGRENRRGEERRPTVPAVSAVHPRVQV